MITQAQRFVAASASVQHHFHPSKSPFDETCKDLMSRSGYRLPPMDKDAPFRAPLDQAGMGGKISESPSLGTPTQNSFKPASGTLAARISERRSE